MDVEETVHNAALWAAYSDAELLAIHERIVASIPPAEMASVLPWMLPAIAHVERVGMLGGMRAQMPAPVFAGVMQLARERLDGAEWRKLERVFGETDVGAMA
jgi:hypothetical protein